MSSQTTIEWTHATWNPVTGCTKVSPGCAHCYAETFAERWRGVPGHAYEQGFDLRLWPERLELPLRWRKPKRIFVNSMSDLFHPDVPGSFVAQVWDTMAQAHWHTFQVLTKRPERMPGLLAELGLQDPPLANVWLGTSIENRRFVGRAEHLRRTPAVVRFISAEPLLGPLRCSHRRWPDGYTGPSLCLTGIDWLTAGGESGPQHRPVGPEWVRDLRDACQRADTAFFFKQWGGARPKSGGRELDGSTWDELPRPQGPDDVSPRPRASSSDVSRAAAGALSGSLPSAAQGLDTGQRDGQLSIVPESSPGRARRPRTSGADALSASPRVRVSRNTSPRSRRDTSSSLPARESAELADAPSPIAPTTGAGSPSERTPARSRAGRRVVRRSEPLAKAAATDPSSETGGSAPPSTGDMSLLEHQQPGVRELLLAVLSAADKRLLLEGGIPRHELSSSSGPLRPEVTLRLREILVRQYTPAAWRSHLAWHTYWGRHGGVDFGNDELMAASPPTPRSDHRKVRVTWGQARKWVREEAAVLEAAHELLAGGDTSLPPASATHATRRLDQAATSGCACCSGPMPDGLRPDAKFCGKPCRQAASRARLKARPARSPSPPPDTCAWCGDPMPDGLRPEARYCSKRCRQASSRFGLAIKHTAATSVRASGPGDASSRTSLTAPAPCPACPPGGQGTSGSSCGPGRPPADTTRRRPPRREVLDDASHHDCARPRRFAYADPPYPGKAGYYPEQAEVDHQALVERLVVDFPDGWALSTSAEALQQVLALCPAAVRVCAWQRAVRPTRSRRPISAWEPLIVCGGRELALDEPQTIRDALAYGGRFRAFPGALVGMKPPQFAVWMFRQLGAGGGDELVDLYPGSGAISEAWRRYAGVDGRHVADVDEPAPASTAAAGEASDTPPVGQQCLPRPYDLAAVCSEQALACPVNGARCESIACIDVGCTAADANVDAGRAA